MTDLLEDVGNIQAMNLLIDTHLAAIDPERSLITVDEHVNILLDIRNTINATLN